MYCKLLDGFALIFVAILLFSCDVSNSVMDDAEKKTSDLLTVQSKTQSGVVADMYRSTGELWARWEGCEDGHEEPSDHNDGCPGEHETELVPLFDDCLDDISIAEHEEGKCQGTRPAREFYLDYNAHLFKDKTKGKVSFRGTGSYEGVDFNGNVSWVEVGRGTNELFFGGKITRGTVDRGCFLFSVQDNGEGKIAEADRLQYRLYGSEKAPCHIPSHFPKGYPIALYEGNLQVH